MRTGAKAVNWFAVSLLMVGALTYSVWVLGFFLPNGLSSAQSPVDEATADGQPYRDLFRTFTIIAGIAYLLSVPPLLRSAPVDWKARLTVAMVALFGLLVLLSAVFTLDCASSVSEVCRESAAAGTLSTEHALHRTAAVAADLAFPLGTVSLVIWWPPNWRRLAVTGLVLYLLSWVTTVLLLSLGPGHYAGLAERAQYVLQSLIVLVTSTYMIRDAR